MSYQRISGSKILVTGGAGFIGSNICEDLLKNKNEVICLDNFSTGFKSNIQEFEKNRKFTLIEGDIRDIDTCIKACENVDYVLHQAALGSVPRSIENPINTNNTNISGFLNMLVAARDAGVKRFVYAASSSTYGDSQELPKIEDKIGKPLSPYAVTKFVNELYAHVFRINYGLETIGLRYFNVFGPKQSPEGAYAAVIPNFIEKLIKHESPVINGDGSFTRDFTYIENVIQMNHLALTTNNEKAIGEVFNTAVNQQISLKDLSNKLKAHLSEIDPEIANILVKYAAFRKGDIPHSLASIEKATNLLGYKPSHDLDEGLKASISWYFDQLK